MISLAELTTRVQIVSDIYAVRFDLTRDDDWFLLKLQEELGELTQAHLRLTGRARTGAADTPALERARADEAADVLGMLLLYCRRFGVDLEQAVADKWLVHLPPPFRTESR